MTLSDLEREARSWQYVLACPVDQRDVIEIVTTSGRSVAVIADSLLATTPATRAGKLLSYLACRDLYRARRQAPA